MKIGIIVAMPEEAKHITEYLDGKCKSKSEVCCRYSNIAREIVKYKMGNKLKIFVATSGIGQNNAMISCAELDKLGCKTIINIGSCGVIKTDTFVHVSDYFSFYRNIRNYGFQLHPEKYFYDDCDYFEKDKNYDCLLLTCNDFVSDYDLDKYDLNKHSNIFADMEAYSIMSYCVRFGIVFKCYKFITDFGDEKTFDENVLNKDVWCKLPYLLDDIIYKSEKGVTYANLY